jgi:uncharacterized phage protein (TIGR02216 family)
LTAAKDRAGLYPFDKAMAFGLGVLRLEPSSFWAMTPVELALLAGGFPRPAKPIGRGDLDGLIERFPDRN